MFSHITSCPQRRNKCSAGILINEKRPFTCLWHKCFLPLNVVQRNLGGTYSLIIEIKFINYLFHSHSPGKFAKNKCYWDSGTLDNRFSPQNIRVRDNPWIKFYFRH